MNRLARLLPQRLFWRVALGSLVLLVLLQAAVFWLLATRIQDNARSRLAAELKVAEGIWHTELQSRAQTMLLGTTLLARDSGFVAAVGKRDAGTTASALDNQRERIGADAAAVFGQDLQDLAPAGDAALAPQQQAMRLAAGRFLHGGQRIAIELVGGTPFQFVTAPLPPQVNGGAVVMGFRIDQKLLDVVKAKSLADLAIVTRLPGRPARIDTATLDPVQRAGLLRLAAQPGFFRDLGRGDLLLAAGDSRLPLAMALGEALPARAVLLGSLDQAMQPYQALMSRFLVITAAGVGLFFLGSLLAARWVTTPLISLARASEKLGHGDYAAPIPYTGRRDETGDLAQAMDRMRRRIDSHQAEIRRLAYWDRLTGLPNRAQFSDALHGAIAAAGTAPVAVVMLDLDRFKHVNEQLGYAFGDRLLQGVAERLGGQTVREGDLVARLSGDEFALLLPGSTAEAALAVAERVADVFRLPMTLDDHTVDVAASFGVSCWPAHGPDVDTLLKHAELAMYEAKRTTRAMLVYDPSIDAGSERSLSLLSQLRQALEQGELRLFLQPKITLASGRLTGAEALVRWQHPVRGMVPPMDFIPFAEQTGIVRELTLWMLEATAGCWASLRGLGLHTVSVNLSTRDLLDQDLPFKLDAITQRHGMPAQALCLEITESAIMDDPQRALATLVALSRAGYRLSIDDFGTGYSSLQYLQKLPVDELKIDKGFVMAMARNDSDAKIVRSVIDLAHTLGLTVVAEGVENEAGLARLRELDCDEAQGFHIGRPLPAAEMAAFAARWAAQRQGGSAVALLH
ncbi:MAG: EAL domain-containing protein [Burkholderiales bacterium]|nr:EAL domain-containing protein [Burkholderiales bacterium]